MRRAGERDAILLAALDHARSSVSEDVTYQSTADVQRTSSGMTVVHLRQEHAGIPVRDAVRSVRFGLDGTPGAFTGSVVVVPPETPIVPKFGARAATHEAFLRMFSDDLIPEHVTVTAERPEVVAVFPHPSAPTVLRKRPFVEPIVASLTIDVEDGRSRLVWDIRLGLPDAGWTFAAIVTAAGRGRRPRVRSIHRLSAHAIRGDVFQYDPRTARESAELPRPRDDYPSFGGGSIDKPAWVDVGETRGNNTVATDSDGKTFEAVIGDAGGLVFSPADPQGIEQSVLNAFYVCNVMHDFFLLLGFDEDAGNFQRINDPGVGLGDDALDVEVWDSVLSGFAFFQNRPDGTTPTMKLGRFGPRHTALDADIVMHEFVHGVTSRIIGGKHIHTPLTKPQSRALGEGFSDYYALTVQNYYRRKAGDPEEWSYGAWIADRPTGLRTSTYDAYPNTYGFLKKPNMTAHRAGEVWCATLLDLNAALAAHSDRDQGDEWGWQLVFDSLHLLHPGPNGPTYLHARDALISSFDAAVAAGSIAADPVIRASVLEAFRTRGMGPGAQSPDAEYKSASEAFA